MELNVEYFKKNGSKSHDEQAIILQIERFIKEKQIPRSSIPLCQSKDDLLEVLSLAEAYVTEVQKAQESSVNPEVENTVNEQPVVESEEKPELQPEPLETVPESSEPEETVVSEEKQPLEAKTESVDKDTEHTKTTEEPKVKRKPNFVAEDYDPFGEEIKQRSYNTQGGGEKATSEKTTTENNADEQSIPELEETPIDDLNPKTKRRVAEQTAETLLKGYARLVPKPFKWLARMDEAKIERLHFEGVIDINIEVSPGTTFDEWVKQTNEKVEELFEVDEDTLNEIREPLIEVLLEQKMELTPQQRLLMAVVSHLVQMLTVALGLQKQNNRILEYQKRATMMAGQRMAA